MTEKSNLSGKPMVWYGIILIIVGLLLLTFVNFPILFLQLGIVLFPVILAVGAGYVMYKKNSHKVGEAFLYSSGALVLAASVELIVLFFILQSDVYSKLISNFQGLEFPIAVFALAVSIVTGIESTVSIRNNLAEINERLKINDVE
ncbi:MAG: hypothetical protein ABSG49_05370 [Methanoregula sp.]|jgi:hypothetical protein|uniref:hypothetical protein n=1 Tax=Methanoregula sp. TaxID=2052170 RepID=UPI003C2362A1